MPGPLAHVRVLDLTRILAGPWCSQNLADLGADVIKVERPDGGDDSRGWGPPFPRDAAGRDGADSAYFLSANRGKRSLTLNLAHPEGQRIARALAGRCDVLLENFKVGGLRQYGLDHAALSAENPGLIYCSITGFGQDGPYAAHAGYDFLVQGLGGLMSVTGERDDLPGGGPQRAGVAVADLMTGMYASVAVLAALVHRERTGVGQHIDLALLDTQVAMLANQALSYLTSGVAPTRTGNAHPTVIPYQAFRTRDGHLILAVGNDGQFARLCAVLELPALARDPRFVGNADRHRHRDILIPQLSARFATRSTDEWVAALQAAGVPCGAILSIDRVFADPQVRHRGLRLDLPHPAFGSVPTVRSPLRLSRTPVEHRRAPPLLGQHTDEVLGELLGYDAAELARLRAAGVV